MWEEPDRRGRPVIGDGHPRQGCPGLSIVLIVVFFLIKLDPRPGVVAHAFNRITQEAGRSL